MHTSRFNALLTQPNVAELSPYLSPSLFLAFLSPFLPCLLLIITHARARARAHTRTRHAYICLKVPGFLLVGPQRLPI